MVFYSFFILALSQGILEFFPISSSAHLFLIESLFLETNLNKSLASVLHFASLLAIFIYLRTHIFSKERVKQVFFASLPLIISFFIKQSNSLKISFFLVGNAWLINSVILFITANIIKYQTQNINNLDKIGLKRSFLIGLGQALAIFPGISRLGLTVFIAVILGIKIKTAIIFSFIIALVPYFFVFLLDFPSGLFSSLQTNNIIGFSISFILCASLSIIFLHFIIKIASYKIWKFFAIYCFFLALIVLNIPKKTELSYQYKIPIMGTSCIVRVWGGNETAAQKSFTKIQEILFHIDRELSTHKEDSSIVKFNKLGANISFKPSKVFWDNLLVSKELWQKTDGIFNPSINPLIQLWKQKLKKKELPSKIEIQKAQKNSSFELISIDEKNKIITKKLPELSLNFGGIAKGYALDKIVEILRQNSYRHFYINLGGSSIYYAHPKKPLKVKILNPLNKNKLFVNLKNQGVSTSGNYLQSTVINGEKYSHIINPKTGRPNNDTVSCSVVIDNNTLADALSTYFFILGVEKSKDIFYQWKKSYPKIKELILSSRSNEIRLK